VPAGDDHLPVGLVRIFVQVHTPCIGSLTQAREELLDPLLPDRGGQKLLRGEADGLENRVPAPQSLLRGAFGPLCR
jgi:hypothetical protein